MDSKGMTPRSSRGFRNRNQRVEPPSRESLTNGVQEVSLLRLSQRILGGKAVVSTKILFKLTIPQAFFDAQWFKYGFEQLSVTMIIF